MSRELGAAYLLDSRIGSGASGEVWRGHLRAGDDRVAVKMLRRHLAGDPTLVTRFLRERDILVGLDHPNVVSVIDLVAEAGRLGIVMQLVEGGDLRRYLELAGGRLSPEAASALLAQVAAGLSAAHAAGVVHRDLKPENILVDLGEDGSVVARITDFGVSYLVGQPALTRAGNMVGTPLYAAPEVSVGSTLTPAADVYALGVIAYELATGRPPFDADNPWALMRLHVEEAPARPADVPDALWDVIASCLAKDPSARPAAAAAAEAFRALSPRDLQGRAGAAAERTTVHPASRRALPPAPSPPPSPPGPGRRRSVLIAGFVILALLVTGIVSLIIDRSDSPLVAPAIDPTTTIFPEATVTPPTSVATTASTSTAVAAPGPLSPVTPGSPAEGSSTPPTQGTQETPPVVIDPPVVIGPPIVIDPPVVTPATPAKGEWQARPGNSELTGCSDTQRADNLYWNVCVSGTRAVVVVTVTNGTHHYVTVPRISMLVNGSYSAGIYCDTIRITQGANVACFGEMRTHVPGETVKAYGQMHHDDIVGSFLYSSAVLL